MANDSLMACLATSTPAVIPAKAGIQSHHKARYATSTALDTRLRGYDGAKDASGLRAAVTPSAVIPAKAGIQSPHKARYATSTALDTRLRGYDGVKSRDELSDAVEIFRAGV